MNTKNKINLIEIENKIKAEEYRFKAFKKKKFPSIYTLYQILNTTNSLFSSINDEDFELKGEYLLRLSVLKLKAFTLLKDFERQERIPYP